MPKEFYSPISASVDRIEVLSNTIEQNTIAIENNVNEIKNTDLSNVSLDTTNIRNKIPGVVQTEEMALVRYNDIQTKVWRIEQDTQDIQNILSGGVGIKSVQRGTFTANGNSTSYDIAISSVDISKSYINFSQTGPTYSSDLTKIYLLASLFLNATSVRFLQGGVYGSTNNFTVSWEIIEFA